MPKISAVIITFNEENSIERCIRSVLPVVDDIVVLDSYSTDRTEEICKSLGVRFVQNHFEGYRTQKNLAVQLASFDYILSLDADEALSVELKESILKIKEHWDCDAYSFNRFNNYCGQWIKHSNWYPDKKIRLFDRRKGEWSGYNVHETVKMQNGAKVCHLKGDLLHWCYSSFEEHIEKINKYSTISALEYFRNGRRSTIFEIIFSPKWHFFRSYFLKMGFLDGYIGYSICSLSAHQRYLKYIKLRKLIIENKKNKRTKTKEKGVNIVQ